MDERGSADPGEITFQIKGIREPFAAQKGLHRRAKLTANA
jgi:hypothetical protein